MIRQKGESRNRFFKKIKHAKFSEKRTFLILHTCAYQGVRNVCFFFSENLACFIFLKHPFQDSPLCLIIDDMRQDFCTSKPTQFPSPNLLKHAVPLGALTQHLRSLENQFQPANDMFKVNKSLLLTLNIFPTLF